MSSPPGRTRHVAFTVVTVVVVGGNGLLTLLGVLTPGQALTATLAVEIPLVLLTVALTWRAVLRLRRETGSTWRRALGAHAATDPFLHAARSEFRLFRSLWLWIRGRRDGVSASVAGFDYAGGTMVIPVAFIAVSLLEAVVVHLLVPWQWLRVVLLVLTVYGVVFLLGLLASRSVHPHLVSETRLTLRYGAEPVAVIPLSAIVSVSENRRYSHTYPACDDDRLYIAGADGTNLDVVLAAPCRVVLPGMGSRAKRTRTVRTVSLHVADPVRLAELLTPART
ncbi:hypothetical protein LX16_3683 [Stackebrandtia albiflava]|uniref:Uncharacterized protein n=1 Tax=Stackebrandtia albiflava TaxID=406432 RepID=A0A562V4V3_9ACTN|nr:hypothetical protein [Stackebrandtia albiflava]TWJ12916.1 hypothetical protein LX16_3683 [Stackebrandtia albiflava]